jgi:dienelactone hydrolase
MTLVPDVLPSLADFRKTMKTYLAKTKAVYRIGESGPGVVLMHEIPGLTTRVLRFGKVLAEQGFRVAMPSLFGQDGGTSGAIQDGATLLQMCVSAEFNVFAADGSSPVVDWLRKLCVDLAGETGAPVGAVGLCITGGFALSLTVGTNGLVRAPVMSEPSLPFPIPLSGNSSAIHLSDVERATIAAHGPATMGLRFTGDPLCTRARFDSYESLLEKRFIRIELESPDEPNGIRSGAHSVLTNDLVNIAGNPTLVALDRVIAFLRTNLSSGPHRRFSQAADSREA